jgi:hypothetical protein
LKQIIRRQIIMGMAGVSGKKQIGAAVYGYGIFPGENVYMAGEAVQIGLVH